MTQSKNLNRYLTKKITAFAEKSLLRKPIARTRTDSIHVEQEGVRYLSFACNDYLGLTHHPEVKQAAIHATKHYGTGGGASRLVTGNHSLYTKIEAQLAALKHTEDAVVFGSGYLANIGVITALMDRHDLILIDKLAHACLLDGAQLCGAKVMRFRNNDLTQVDDILTKHRADYRHALIITDAIFSMDGHEAPLAALGEIANHHDTWLLSDGAHGLGVVPCVSPVSDSHIQTGTLSKAVGGYGGYVCGSRVLCDFLRSQARSLIYSTALPPATLAAASKALELIASGWDRGDIPLQHARYFAHKLGLPPAHSAIVPLIIGEETLALQASEALKEAGYLVIAIRPPTVPAGTSRLRFTFSALHCRQEVDKLITFIKNQRWIHDK
jgi:8-amino-7-oxononanoate synthase